MFLLNLITFNSTPTPTSFFTFQIISVSLVSYFEKKRKTFFQVHWDYLHQEGRLLVVVLIKI